MNTVLLIILAAYFLMLLLVSHLTSKNNDNAAFFSGDRKSPWYLVAFGMIGASISGISLISVPGMVEANNWYYIQMCIGFFFGYIAVAYVLLPLYYRLGLTSIYEYLNQRFGTEANKTGSTLFVIAKLISSATKLYIVILVLQQFIFNSYSIPFWLTTIICVTLIWIYTRKSGIKTIVWTDTIQTLFLLLSIILIVIESYQILNTESFWNTMLSSEHSTVFHFDDWKSPQHFVKQFLSGIFIVIVMTGLDQDMMQKNLTIRTLKESQRNMLSYGAAFIPVNILLLCIGTAMILYYEKAGLSLPTKADTLLPEYVANFLSPLATISLIIGIISAAFSSADSALTSITTTLSIDIFGTKGNDTKAVRTRKQLHIGVCAAFSIVVILFEQIPSKSIIDTIYTIVGYAYGPLLGLFSFGLLTKKQVTGKAIPVIAILSPALCYIINIICINTFNYKFGYELLILNGMITFVALYLFSTKKNR